MSTNKPQKPISPIKIINQNTVQKENNIANKSLNESDTDDVFNYDWTEVVSPKSKKRLNSNKQTPLSKTIKTNTNTQFSSYSKFTTLTQNENENTEMETNTEEEIVTKLPPPIFIKTKIQNYQVFCEKIKNKIDTTDDFSCKTTSESLKLNTISSNAYRSIVTFFKE